MLALTYRRFVTNDGMPLRNDGTLPLNDKKLHQDDNVLVTNDRMSSSIHEMFYVNDNKKSEYRQ